MRLREWARPVALTWLLLAGVSGALLLRATLTSPPGTVFAGTFAYIEDFYNYLSYVQQAEDGALVFRNKLAPPHLPPALVNLEWLLVGWVSVLLGGAPLLAYRLTGLAALVPLVLVIDRWLVRGGLPPSRRLGGLLLVSTGGGLGGLFISMGWLGTLRPFDLLAGLYPFVEALGNPHFVIATALFAAALGAFAGGRPVVAVALGNVLALVRPYDAALLAGVQGLVVLLSHPPREWPRRLAPVAALGPVLAYNAWVFLWSPGFRVFSNPRYGSSGPTALELLLAIGPAALVSLLALRLRSDGDGRARQHRLYLALWAALALAIVVLRPVSFSLQFLTGTGVPLLALGAIALGRMQRGLLEIAVVLFAGTALTLTWTQLDPNPYRNVPAERWGVAAALRPICQRGELVLAPADIGVYVGGLTACWPWVSHSFSPEHESRSEAMQRFDASPPAKRGRFVEEVCAAYVVAPAVWALGGLPPGAPYERRVEVDGVLEDLAVYSRVSGVPCDGGTAASP